MKYKIQANLAFDVDVSNTTIHDVIEELELSFNKPDGCEIVLTENEFVVSEEDDG